MTRAWTQEEIASWKDARDKKRQNQGLPPFDELDANAKKAALKTQRAELFKSTELTLKSTAWPLGRYPLFAYPAPRSGVLELPRHYLSSFGCDRVSYYYCDHFFVFVQRKKTNPHAYKKKLFFFYYNHTQLKFKKGDNLNLLTYRYYNELVDPVSYMGSNYVTEVVIQPKRFFSALFLLLYD